MVKCRNNKILIVFILALVIVMSFSVSAFAGVNGSSLSASDIISAFNVLDDDIFKGKWAPNNSPSASPSVSILNTLYYSDGFAVVSSSDFSRIQTYLSGHSLGQDYEWYIYTVTGISDLFDRVYVDASPINKQPINTNAKLRALEYFADKEISYFYNATLGYVLCNFANQPILYVADFTVNQKDVANIPVQAAGNTVLNEDNRNYYYDQSSETTEIYEGDTITYEGDEIINEGDTITTNNYDYGVTFEEELIDLSGGIINLPGGEIYQIEDYIYNDDSDTYYFSTTKNNKEYNFTVQYYYDYTYVVYLGSSEEYKPEAYKFYYELPDGRSSADLTADELAGMSVQFNDLVTYDRVPSDEVVKGLFHLDGDLENSTVYDGVEMFFTSGASITYQEAANFDGALYLPALSGARQIIIPLHDTSKSDLTYYSNAVTQYMYTSDGNTNFAGMPYNSPYSIDFRFYSYAAAGDTSKYLEVYGYDAYKAGGTYRSNNPSNPILTLNGNTVVFNGRTFDGNQINNITASVSVGTWNHILINFEPYLDYDGYRYRQTCYLNGVLIGSVSSNIPTVQSSYIKDSMLLGFNMRSSSNTVPFMLDEIRITSANVPNLVSPVPYEDNLVWVLPDSTNFAANTLAIQSDYLSGKYRVGGIRPSMVEKGHVWFQISMNRIISCQVYNGIMWEEVNCYVWTGSRWIPANYFDVVTLTDYYDIADNTGLPTITTSEGFFSWFQREFKEFKDKAIAFFDAWEGGEYSAGGTTNNNTTIIAPSLTANGTLDANISINNNFEFDLGTNAGDVLRDGFDGVSGIFRGFGQLTQGSNYGLITNFGNAVTTFFNSFLTPDGLFGYLFLNPFE